VLALPPALAPLGALNQFIIVRLVPSATRPGKTEKFPIDWRDGSVSNAHDPDIWVDAKTACAMAPVWGADHCVGFVFTRDCGFWFLDVDGCLQPDGTWSPIARELCAALPGAAVEVSQSGRGLHLFGRGLVPPHSSKRGEAQRLGLEFYTEGRFVALTGNGAVGSADADLTLHIAPVVARYFPPAEAGTAVALDAGPVPEWRGPTDDDELIRRALQSKSAGSIFGGRASFADLWHGDAAALARAYPATGDDPYDRSSADAALAQHLAFWTGKDGARIERLMRQSALVRDKWDREDYLGARTIANALRMQVDVLQDKPIEMPALPAMPAGAAPAPVAAERRRTGETFLGAEAQLQLFNGCTYVTSVHRVLVPGGHLLKPDVFKTKFGGYTFMMDDRNERTSRDAWEAFTQSQVLRCPQADGTIFKPDLPYGALVDDGGRTLVNTWWPVDTPKVPGDISLFLDLVQRLLPVPRDRLILTSYMCAVVQHKGVKFNWMPFLQGVEGNGKTTLMEAVAYAVGARYSHWPAARKIAANFNAWLVGTIFIAVDEVFIPRTEQHVLEVLKPMVTGKTQEVEKKGVDQGTEFICCNLMAVSNHKSGLPKSANDRRIAPFFCPQQSKEDLVRAGMNDAYFARLRRWLDNEDGWAKVNHWLHTAPIPDEFNPALGGIAPVTSCTDEAIARGRSMIEDEILEAISEGRPGFCGGWVSSLQLGVLLERMGRGNVVSRARQAEILAALGYVKHPALPDGRVNNMVLPDGGKPRLFLRPDMPAFALKDPGEIARAYTAAQTSA
jgi:hypothetical protein